MTLSGGVCGRCLCYNAMQSAGASSAEVLGCPTAMLIMSAWTHKSLCLAFPTAYSASHSPWCSRSSGLIPLIFRESPRLWAFAIAAALVVVAIAFPQALAPLNRVWHRVRIVLNAVLTFVLMGLLFYGVVLPTGLIMRALRKDLLNLRYDADARSYWIERDPPGPDPESMNRQF